MKKCLKITLKGNFSAGILCSFVQKYARKLHIEGTAQLIGSQEVLIVACGTKVEVDSFLDVLHKASKQWSPEDVFIEPFLKEKDYRGIFRVIE